MTKEQIITLITEKYFKAKEKAKTWFKMYESKKEAKESEETISLYERTFLEYSKEADTLESLLQQILLEK